MKKERRDAYLVEGLDGLHGIFPYLFPKRTESEVFLQEKFDVTELLEYIQKRNEENPNVNRPEGQEINKDFLMGKLSFFHAFCTAIARTVYLRPKMNIFISGYRYWQRKDISLSFVAKRQFADGAEESVMWLKIDPDWSINELAAKIIGDVTQVRKSSSGSDADGTVNAVAKLPRWMIRLVFAVVNKLEYWGIVPEALTKGDSNYSTVMLTNLGSIKAPSVYHHLNNYGTNSIMISIGTITKENILQADGSVVQRDMVDVGFIIDERIADGFYFAKSLRITKYLLEHPDALLQKISDTVPVEL